MAKTNTQIFKASEVDSSRPNEWIVDLSPADVVNPDCYFYFPTKARAVRFFERVIEGEGDASQIYREMDEAAKAASALGAIRSARKAASSAANGRKGGRPRRMPAS